MTGHRSVLVVACGQRLAPCMRRHREKQRHREIPLHTCGTHTDTALVHGDQRREQLEQHGVTVSWLHVGRGL